MSSLAVWWAVQLRELADRIVGIRYARIGVIGVNPTQDRWVYTTVFGNRTLAEPNQPFAFELQQRGSDQTMMIFCNNPHQEGAFGAYTVDDTRLFLCDKWPGWVQLQSISVAITPLGQPMMSYTVDPRIPPTLEPWLPVRDVRRIVENYLGLGPILKEKRALSDAETPQCKRVKTLHTG